MEKKYKFIRILGKPKNIILLIPEQLKKEWEKQKTFQLNSIMKTQWKLP